MKRIEETIVKWLLPKKKIIKWISRIVNILVLVVLLFWITDTSITVFDSTLDQEPLFVGLTMLFALLNQIHRTLLNESEFSPAYALAVGYFNNFISPVVTQLKENGIRTPKIYIYKPEVINELFKENVDRVKAEIKNNSFELSEVNLSLKHGRARDVLQVQKSKTKRVYFDFPNTLTSIIPYVDYKINSRENNASEEAKKKLTEELIQKFYDKLDELIKTGNIGDNVKYCDKQINLEF